jgi:hypothetical protein
MKYTDEIGSGAIIYVPGLIRIDLPIQKLARGKLSVVIT